MRGEGEAVDPRGNIAFAAEVERLRQLNVPGASGRLRALFDFLADRGADAPPASQAEIAECVFGQTDSEGDDATVRVYIHRLRKRMEEFYAGEGERPGASRLTIPPGSYALRLEADAPEDAEQMEGVPVDQPGGRFRSRRTRLAGAALLLAVLLLGAGFFAGRATEAAGEAPPVNALWQPFVDSSRPVLIVLGDYYIYGEIDPVRPEEGRLVRDFRVNSPTDLVRMQDVDPDKFANAEDVGLNYLPFSAAYGLQEIVPVLTRGGRQVNIIPASQLEPDMLNYFNVIYVGLVSGMHLLEDINFMDSRFQVGESYDELIDTGSGQVYMSDEARRIASPAYYTDYGYFARFHAPSGALVAVVAGARDTGLRGIAPLVAAAEIAPALAKPAADGKNFEALYQITGQQGADLSEKFIVAHIRK
ncbi:conserved hypothetical protein [Altererythrobacter sp. B11]|uniref:hypothetical protein n=1 Tax=Altererythrobacter sp. B11 TaxID=2060312 RepID=UPI000DC6E69D|nr:hypothetical protein [Altererythrobacter sp. B11]BBC70927.1 conserved hypothetical protein [Altererythrobacter sp. B11]